MFKYSGFVLVFYVGYLVLIFGLGYGALHRKSPTPDLTANKIVFRTPSVLLIVEVMFVLCPALLGLLALPMMIADTHNQSHSLAEFLWFSAAYVALFGAFPLGLLALFLAHSTGPQMLCLDKDQGSYTLRSGTFLKPKVRSGSWQDIAGVFVRPVSGKGQILSYGVYFAWHPGVSGAPVLGLCPRQAQAERLAEEIATSLGLPVVGPSNKRVAGAV